MAKRRTLRAIKPSAALAAAYKKKLLRLVDDMQRSVVWWIRAAYRKRESEIVQDAGPARSLAQELESVMRDWQRDYDAAAKRIARWFVSAAARHVGYSAEAAFKAAKLNRLMTVNFKYMSRTERDVIQSLIIENVNLITSIPRHYLTEVQGIVQRSVQTGRDVGGMVDELHERYGITRRRAITIANDQNNKATENLARERMKSLGITEGVWQHNPIGKTYRTTHEDMDGKIFSLSEGMYDPDPEVERYIQPAELVNCHCTFKPVIPDFSKGSEE